MEIPLPTLVAGITHADNYGTLTKSSRREEGERLGRTVNCHLSCWSRVAFCYELVTGFPLGWPVHVLVAQSSHHPTTTTTVEEQKPEAPPRQQGDLTLHASAVHSLSWYATSPCYWLQQPSKTLILDHVDLGVHKRTLCFLQLAAWYVVPPPPGQPKHI